MFSKDKKFIAGMFDEISPSYDRLNHLFSGRQDLRWRRIAVARLLRESFSPENIIDLAAGSGDLGIEFMKLNPGRMFSIDISMEMLRLNRMKNPNSKNIFLMAEAENLPFKDDFADLIGIAFGIRNFEKLKSCHREIHRVLKKGGKLLVIEMFRPEKKKIAHRVFDFYFSKIVPKAGNIFSKSDYAYNYLFSSVDTFISVSSYCSLLKDTGFEIEYCKNNFLGIVNSVQAKKI